MHVRRGGGWGCATAARPDTISWMSRLCWGDRESIQSGGGEQRKPYIKAERWACSAWAIPCRALIGEPRLWSRGRGASTNLLRSSVEGLPPSKPKKVKRWREKRRTRSTTRALPAQRVAENVRTRRGGRSFQRCRWPAEGAGSSGPTRRPRWGSHGASLSSASRGLA